MINGTPCKNSPHVSRIDVSWGSKSATLVAKKVMNVAGIFATKNQITLWFLRVQFTDPVFINFRWPPSTSVWFEIQKQILFAISDMAAERSRNVKRLFCGQKQVESRGNAISYSSAMLAFWPHHEFMGSAGQNDKRLVLWCPTGFKSWEIKIVLESFPNRISKVLRRQGRLSLQNV